jgi:hypothetical protein
MPAPYRITYFTLLKKYAGDITKAHPMEKWAALLNTPNDMTHFAAYQEAVNEYRLFTVLKAAAKGKAMPCINRQGLCEDDKCNCW